MKLHQMRYLVAVAAQGSIRAAARTLGVTQAAVTQGMRELESECQLAMFTRHSGGIGLTDAGRDLLHHAQRILEQMHRAEQDLARHRDAGAPQRLSIGVTPWVAQTLLARVLASYRIEMPHVRLELFDGFSALAYPKLREGSLDLMIGRIAAADELHGLQASPLFTYEATVMARAGHPRAGASSIHQLLDDDWVLNFAPDGEKQLMEQLFVQHGAAVPRQRIHLAQSAALMLTLVQQTDMLTFCPWPLVETASLRGTMVALQLREQFAPRTVGIIRRSNETLSQPAERFLVHFIEQMRAGAVSTDPELRRVFYSVEMLA
ncbi:LysR family transcriptional regulator [Variovorax sp. M-6]|uniref:LysR family transcriptional regulator n=1 Tax=Variovorax sp. M-6 TaxID=3233041 RepID=UPI003F9666EE